MENENKYFIVRCNRAGVFFGQIAGQKDNRITMRNVRKLWCWDGACAVEELAVNGTKKPENCKFTIKVEEMTLADPIQIIPCTDAAVESINGVEAWKY